MSMRSRISYLREFRANWQGLLSTALGLASGLGMTAYLSSIFAPHLIAEFGWSKAQFALTNLTALAMFVAVPIAGRMADLFGVRCVAIIGITAVPLCLLGFSLMSGQFGEFILINGVINALGATTTTTVYSRIVVEQFDRARGLALAIAIAGPATVGALCAPLLIDFIDGHGWRAGYRASAAFAACGGILALLLLPKSATARAAASVHRQRAVGHYPSILRNPTFWLIFIAMFLCNLPQTLSASQLALVLMDTGASTSLASSMVSMYATGVLIGRFVCGLALDRLPTAPVAALGMGLPAVGLFILASNVDAPAALAASVLFLGLSQGAEGDLIAYIVARYFPVDIYGSVLGLTNAAVGVAAATGALLLSLTIKHTDGFALFLFLTGCTVTAGSVLLLFLGCMPARKTA